MTVTDALPYDLHEALVDVKEAARCAGVSTRVVHNWVTRGYLDRDGRRVHLPVHGDDGARWFRPIDVLHAEAATRRRAGSRRKHAS